MEMEPRETERERAQREEEEEERVRQEEEEEKEAVRLEEMAKALRARRMQRQRGRVEASSVEQNPAGNLDQDNVVVEERTVMEGAGVHTDSGGTEGSNGSKTVRNANNVNGNVHHEASDREDDDIVGGDDFDEGEGEESNAQGKVVGGLREEGLKLGKSGVITAVSGKRFDAVCPMASYKTLGHIVLFLFVYVMSGNQDIVVGETGEPFLLKEKGLSIVWKKRVYIVILIFYYFPNEKTNNTEDNGGAVQEEHGGAVQEEQGRGEHYEKRRNL